MSLNAPQEQREASLLKMASEMLGSEAIANTWISSPARALDGVTPLAFSATDEGFEKVMTLIYQLEHGVYV